MVAVGGAFGGAFGDPLEEELLGWNRLHIHIYIYIYVYICHVCMYIYIERDIYVHTYIYIYIHMYMYVCMCIYIYVYIYIHTHMFRKHIEHIIRQRRNYVTPHTMQRSSSERRDIGQPCTLWHLLRICKLRIMHYAPLTFHPTHMLVRLASAALVQLRSVFRISCLFLRPRLWQFEI